MCAGQKEEYMNKVYEKECTREGCVKGECTSTHERAWYKECLG